MLSKSDPRKMVPLSCVSCNLIFGSISVLQSHLETFHNTPSDPTPHQSPSVQPDLRSLVPVKKEALEPMKTYNGETVDFPVIQNVFTESDFDNMPRGFTVRPEDAQTTIAQIEPEVPLEHSPCTGESFQCRYCDLTFSSSGLRSRHIRSVHRGQKQCGYCGKFFSENGNLSRHVRQKHRNSEMSYKSSPSDKTFASKESLFGHKRTCHRNPENSELPTDNKCDLTFVTNVTARLKGETNKSTLKKPKFGVTWNGPLQCHYCDETFGTISERSRHTLTYHKDLLICEYCGHCANSKRNLRLHIRSKHRNNARHFCNIFDKQYTSMASLKKHTREMHTGQACEFCDKIFPNINDLEVHIRNYHKISMQQGISKMLDSQRLQHSIDNHSETTDLTNDPSTMKWVSTVQITQKDYNAAENWIIDHSEGGPVNIKMTKHKIMTTQVSDDNVTPMIQNMPELRSKHVDRFMPEPEMEDNFYFRRNKTLKNTTVTCQKCGKAFGGPKAIRRLGCHVNNCNKKLNIGENTDLQQEPESDNDSDTSSYDKRSKKRSQIKLGTFKCRLCDMTFTQSKILESHKKLNYSDGKSPIPTKTNSPKSNNTNDEVKISKAKLVYHRVNGRFVCLKCPNRFTSRSQIALHNHKVHLGKITFGCDFCHKEFTEEGNMKVHVKSIHEGHSFKCKFCAKKFSQRGNMQKHVKSCHYNRI